MISVPIVWYLIPGILLHLGGAYIALLFLAWAFIQAIRESFLSPQQRRLLTFCAFSLAGQIYTMIILGFFKTNFASIPDWLIDLSFICGLTLPLQFVCSLCVFFSSQKNKWLWNIANTFSNIPFVIALTVQPTSLAPIFL